VTAIAELARRALVRRAPRRVVRVFARRRPRVSLLAALVVMVAVATTSFAPVSLALFGPLVLGVPHLVAVVRHVVARHPARWIALVPILASQALGHPLWGIVAVPVVAFGRRSRRLPATLAAAGVLVLGHVFPHAVALVVLHGHNVVALAWLWRWPSLGIGRRAACVLTAPAGLFALAIALGALDDRFSAEATWWFDRGIDVGALLAAYAPDAAALTAGRWVTVFVLAQGLHYGVWLRLVPELDRPIEGVYSFRQSWRKLAEDVGVAGLTLAAAAVLLLAVWGTKRPLAAREAYLALASFHVYLELALFVR